MGRNHSFSLKPGVNDVAKAIVAGLANAPRWDGAVYSRRSARTQDLAPRGTSRDVRSDCTVLGPIPSDYARISAIQVDQTSDAEFTNSPATQTSGPEGLNPAPKQSP